MELGRFFFFGWVDALTKLPASIAVQHATQKDKPIRNVRKYVEVRFGIETESHGQSEI